MDDNIRVITNNIVDYVDNIGAKVVKNTDEGVAQTPDSEVIPHQIAVEPSSKASEIACSLNKGVEEKPLETRKVDNTAAVDFSSSQQSVETSPTVPEKDDKIVKEEDDKTGDELLETTATYAAVEDSSQQSVETSPAVPEKEDTVVEKDKTGDELPETTATYAAVVDDNTGENS
ncbi:MAG: hypothetical protein LBF42_04015 [Puniceicoccales bacterium]|jgi:hypothetical protein|nr:hypothetical protein [Puniceicoccales bacterium]